MINVINTIIKGTIPVAAYSFAVNGYLGLRRVLTGQSSAQTSAAEFSSKTAADIGFEAARVGLNRAVDQIPGNQVVKAVGHIASDMTVKGIEARVFGQNVTRAVAKNALYGFNTAICSPAGPVAPALTFGAGFATDYMVDKAGDKIDFAYTNYRNKQDQRAYWLQNRNSYQCMHHERIVDDLNNSFIKLSAPAA